ncbi:DUF3833 domain-containing protein [Marinimicrobium sp. C2-29]|uniref:DUF3833 domain-containing protein n=1 Tax=Marinimicrobium sp. C2-29 TaxID=3139825 RepID=UPI0031390622
MRVLLTGLFLLLGACSSTDLQEYAGNQPEFDPEAFFQGSMTAHGVLKNRGGKVTRYFNATIEASWDDEGVGRLAERFEFDDGEIQHRNWTLEPTGDGRYRATAGDVVGPGEARVAGNTMLLNYRLEVDYKDRKLELDVEDWMWRVDENTVINQSILRKWGFRVGSIQLTIIRDRD